MPLTTVHGSTANMDFTLTADGVAVNLTGATVTLELTDKNGASITTTGDVSVITAADGTVRYSPDAADLDSTLSPLRARFKVVDSGSLISYYPNGLADIWTIVPV